jgi:hypothetical protein
LVPMHNDFGSPVCVPIYVIIKILWVCPIDISIWYSVFDFCSYSIGVSKGNIWFSNQITVYAIIQISLHTVIRY